MSRNDTPTEPDRDRAAARRPRSHKSAPSGASEFAAHYDPDVDTDSVGHLATARTGKHPASRGARDQAREEERVGTEVLRRRDQASE
jgi:hypothetical protein